MKKRFMIYLFMAIASSVCITSFIIGGYSHLKMKQVLENQKDDLSVNIKNYLITFDKMLFLIERQMLEHTKNATVNIAREVTENGKLKNNYTSEQLKEIAVSHGVTDISLVNNQGVVINSSVKKDINLNLFGFSPRFKKFIKSIYGKDKVAGHRISLSVSTKELTMFRYYSPLNSDYIIETWTDIKDFILMEYSQKHLDFFFNNYFLRLKQENRFLKSIDLYVAIIKPMKRVSLITGQNMSEKETAITSTPEFKKRKELTITKGSQSTSYMVFAFEEQLEFEFTNSFIVKIDYDFSLLSNFRNNIILYSLLAVIFIILGIFAISSLIFNSYIIKRIDNINKGLENIAQGKYNEDIQIQGNDDIARISENIVSMREKIISRESSLRKNKEKLLQYHDELEQKVEQRTFELAKTNKELEKKKHQAEEANQAKSVFLANMSHEIRTPLNSVLGFSDILQDMIQDKQQKSFLTKIHTSGNALLALINDILDLSKIEAGHLEILPEQVDIKNVFFDISEIFVQKFQNKGLEFKTYINPGTPGFLLLDEAKIRQILINLVGNALKFTEKGRVELRAEFETGNALCDSPGISNLILEIEDTGIGIPKEQQKIIFESFMQQHGQSSIKYGGTGLGLTISKRITEMMNGTMSLESRVGKGSTFKVLIPCAETGPNTGSDTGSDSNLGTGSLRCKPTQDEEHLDFKGAAVLVLDDIALNREMIKEFLLSVSCSVIEAESSEQALDILQNNKNIDLILADIKMPEMDGYAFNETLKTSKSLKNLPVIAVTASALKSDQERIKQHFNGYISKPVDKTKLYVQLKRFLPFDIIELNREIKDEEILPGKKISDNSGLNEILDNKLMPMWTDINETFFIDDVVNFALEIVNIADKYEINSLKTYGRNLHEYGEIFEIDKIEVMINEFPGIIENIRKNS